MNQMNNIQEINQRIWHTIASLQEKLSIDDYEMSNIMRLSQRQFRSHRTSKKSLPFAGFCNLSDKLDLDLSNLLLANFDMNTLYQHFTLNNLTSIKKEYKAGLTQIGKHAIKNTLTRVQTPKNVLRCLQISTDAIDNDNTNFSLDVLVDIFRAVKKFHKQFDYQYIGKMNLLNYQKIFTSNIGPFKNKIKFYSDFFDFLAQTGQNWDFKIENATTQTISLSLYPKESIKDYYKKNNYGSRDVYQSMLGFVKYIPSWGMHSPLKITENKCLFNGDYYANCTLDISNIKPLAS